MVKDVKKIFLTRVLNQTVTTSVVDDHSKMRQAFLARLVNPNKFVKAKKRLNEKEIISRLKSENFQDFFYDVQNIKVHASISLYIRIKNWVIETWNFFFKKKNYLELLLEKAEEVDNKKFITEREVKERQDKLKQFGIRLTEFKKDGEEFSGGASGGWVVEDYKDPKNYHILVSTKEKE